MTFVHAVTPIAGSATPDHPHRPARVDHTTPWPPATSWIVAAAALASVLALGLWAGVLWRYLQPSAFRGSLILGLPRSAGFVLFVARAVAHSMVIAGAGVAAFGRRRAARWLLLGGGAGVITLALISFVTSTLLQSGLTTPRTGPDFVVGIALDGALLVATNLLHLLLVWAMSRKDTEDAAGADRSTATDLQLQGTLSYSTGRPLGGAPVVAAIVAAGAVSSVSQLISLGAITWVNFQPSAFHSIATSWGVAGLIVSILFALGHSAVVAGAALLFWRRRAGRTIFLLGALTIVTVRLYGYARFLVAPPADMPRNRGPEWIAQSIGDIARIGTMLLVYALALLAVTRLAAGLPQLRDD
jgi:hypothetical protein